MKFIVNIPTENPNFPLHLPFFVSLGLAFLWANSASDTFELCLIAQIMNNQKLSIDHLKAYRANIHF
jgi:hypothetical protein